MSRNNHGEGSVYKRKDGRWAASLFVRTTAGTRKRIHVYGVTRAEVHAKLTDRLTAERRGLRTPSQRWTVGSYLEYYLSTVAALKVRPTTMESYRGLASNHVLPSLGSHDLRTLTVTQVQQMLNLKREAGASVRTLHAVRSFLRSVLSQAEREELVARNVAKLVQLPAWHRKAITPWGTDEVVSFLDAARSHRWHGAFLLLLVYGMRRSEVLGLTWSHVDLDGGSFRVAAQLQRLDGQLQLAPVKTDAGNRQLPLIPLLDDVLRRLQPERPTPLDLVFLSSTGTPIDPKNFVRTFHEIRERARLRRITVHHTRHTAATILKDLGVPARDAQAILGHAHVTTTQQLYQHGSIQTQRDALQKLQHALTGERAAVKSAVKSLVSEDQGAEIGALTSGGSSGARTHDTLLKSCSEALDAATLASVTQRLQTRTHVHLIGFAAVKKCCQTPSPNARKLEHSMIALRLLREERYERLALQTFPFTILPAKHGREAQNNHEGGNS